MANSTLTTTPKISVIIPVYNQANYLEDALQSVLAQTYHDYEIVVVNDGSTDASEEIANHYREKIRYIYQKNRGLAGARNTGVRESQGELIALLDSDDIWLPDYLERMVALTEENPQAMVFYCAARCMDEKGGLLEQIVGFHPSGSDGDHFITNLLRANFIIPSTVMIRIHGMAEVGYFDQSLRSCEDWDLWMKLWSRGCQFIGNPSVLVHYRIHGSSLSTNVAQMQLSHRSAVEKHFGKDDRKYEEWDEYKRIAIGGYYRYELLTNIARKKNWESEVSLCKAILADPVNASDLDLFYELALGSQPPGYRGTEQGLNLAENANSMDTLLTRLFISDEFHEIQKLKKIILKTAYKAIGLLAYNVGNFSFCRKYLFLAIKQQPFIVLQDKWVPFVFLKSLFGRIGRYLLRTIRARRVIVVKE